MTHAPTDATLTDTPIQGAAIGHPQPLGVFPFPAGLLLLPADDGTGEITAVRDSLLAGRLPEAWPGVLNGQQMGYAGDESAALAAFTGTDLASRWNRWVLDPSTEDEESVRSGLPSSLRALVDLVQFSTGESDAVPQAAPESAPEVRALVLAAAATDALTRATSGADVGRALALLRQAAEVGDSVSRVLGALFRGNAAALAHEHGVDDADVTADLELAAATLAGTDLHVNRAEIHYQLGGIAHEAAVAQGRPLRTAMHHYNTALQLITESEHPFLWANVHLNLATAYLSTPMTEASDQLRHGVATQALRASLRVFTREAYPAQWGTATLNLANALVYTPSTHQGDNLVEAVELYEEVLAARSRTDDPIGRARVLTNQGNVLAHLGIFDQAKAKLVEARFLFEEQLDSASAMAVRSVLDEIARAHTGDAPDDGSLGQESERQMAQMSRMPTTPSKDAP